MALYVVFLFSATLHEAAHAWSALRGGDPTAYHGGQVTLDPIPHIKREPIGMVVLPLISVVISGWPLGFASAPYDPGWAERHPTRAAWMALAGPGANLLLALCAGLLINIGLFAGVFDAPETIGFADVTMAVGNQTLWQTAAYLLGTVFALNLLLAVFNLLPLPPLDGSAGLVLGLPERIVPRYQTFLLSNPHLALIGIFIAWQAFDYFFDPVFSISLNLLYFFYGASYGG
ncbi:MAG: site-2 protease family protein [Actinobacteria bacterium]|nr:MAG: site-2 protease family protein [Actinomycetota bacterium]